MISLGVVVTSVDTVHLVHDYSSILVSRCEANSPDESISVGILPVTIPYYVAEA
jgi:hypothetical protein